MSEKTYQAVTDRIVAMLESGVRPWSKPWTSDASLPATSFRRPLRENGQPYRGINVINLWCAAEARGFKSSYWLTYKGAQQHGGQVRKGAKSELAFYVGQTTVEDTRKGHEDEERTISFLKSYCVFNADEIEGLPVHFYAAQTPAAPLSESGRIEIADRFIQDTGANIRHGGNRAYYMPALDAIALPSFIQFANAAAYYGTALHELAHWTGAERRCNRNLTGRFGDPAYAAEELVAELTAAFLSADLGICAEPREDHAAYIASWIKALRDDNRAIFKAASLAEKAADFLHQATETEQLAQAA